MAEEKKDVTAAVSVDCRAPATIADSLSRSICVQKVNASISKLIILGILAGVYIGFGACLATLVGHDAAKYLGLGMARFITGAVFSVGLMLVVIAGAELFTGNNLMLMSVLDRRAAFWKMIYKWGIVFAANFIGSVFLAYLYYNTNLWKMGDMAVGLSALKIANAKVGLTFAEALTRGILCNWLVCLAVWIAIASREVIGKVFAIFFPIMAFVALGFEHSIANMYFIPLGLFLKGSNLFSDPALNLSGLTWNAFFVKNLIPVTIGNIIGGAIFVGLLYWVVYVKGTETK
ncbi:MAG: formate/nitrite transporter family protein [Candidatus Omnitrophota bacterium]|nr:formate/nitrite transporter family protein [Candidatus Omnitrophota bacterium]